MVRMLPAFIFSLIALFPSGVSAEEWTSPAELDGAVAYLNAAAVGEDIYLAGGAGVTGPRSDFDAFNTAKDMFRPVTPLPLGMQQFGMAALGSRIYVAGGLEGKDAKPSKGVWAYDIETGSWDKRASLPEARYGHVLIAAGGKLYAFGGTGAGAGSVSVYDAESDRWSKAGTMEAPRALMGAASDGKRIFLVGGQTNYGKASARLDIFTIADGSWSAGPELPVARAGMTAAILDGQLHVVGGVSLDSMKTYDLHDIYDPAALSWRKGASMPTARHSPASAVVGGKWYVFGGGVGAGFFTVFTASDAVEVYTP
ncbi:MAG: hypothetical protein HXY22_03145 [Alphaproteobacteria bacterium]|nr:hypothetical protein [Alphaproteobacteria bacterium]